MLNEDFLFRTKSGDIRTMLVSCDYIQIDNRLCIIMVSADITEYKQTQKALTQTEQRLARVFRLTPHIIMLTNLENGLVTDVNDNFYQVLGFTHDETVGHTTTELGIWGNVKDRQKMLTKLKEKGRVINEEFIFHKKSGEPMMGLFSAESFDINGTPSLVAAITDITERRQMEQALRESEEKFSGAFHAIPEAISISRIKDGVFIDVNEGFWRGKTFTREDAIGHTALDLNLWHATDERERMIERIQKNGPIISEEHSHITKAGRKETSLFSADIIRIGGEPCLLTISNEITERKKMEEALQQALTDLQLSAAQLKATNKELENFSYSVSHDLRAPLRSIDGFSQALLEDYAPKLDETARDYLNRMRNASQKMGDLIDGLLKLSRLTRYEMHFETVDLSAMAQEIGIRLQETFPERKAELIIAPGLKVIGDTQMLRAMMENLLGNAWKFTQKVPAARIEFGSTGNGDQRTFFIKDNGAGFDMAYQDKLFGAFQRLHSLEDFPGTGIGLATVQRIINRHAGNIWAEGAVGRGAAFYFTL
jgi:PAS domain S-box-containing protein